MVVAAELQPARVLLAWEIDTTLLLVDGLLASVYLSAATRIAGSWPHRRTVAFLGGLAVVAIATQSGLARYDYVFTVHVVQHALLAMAAPALILCGAPLTLVLRAARPSTRRRLVRLLHHPVSRLVTHPVALWSLFSASTAVVYLGPLYDLSLRHPTVHVLLHLHFLVAGMLFQWPLFGTDAAVFRNPHLMRLLAALLAVPFHAFVAVALLDGPGALGGPATGQLASLGIDRVSDVRTGAALLWIVGELFSLAIVLAVTVGWMRHSERTAARVEAAMLT